MAVGLDATVAGPAANSYLTVAQADTYFDGRLETTSWADADADDRARALLMATLRIDLEQFEGSKWTVEQRLKWPRFGADDDDGTLFDSDKIPGIVEAATCELALSLLTGESTFAPTGLEGFKRVKVGPIEVEPLHPSTVQSIDLPDIVRQLLDPVLIAPGPTVRLRRA